MNTVVQKQPPMLPGGSPRTRVGIDVIKVADVAESIDRFGSRYIDRLFTPHEIESCTGANEAEHFAARYAAKEATLKVLRPRSTQPSWRSIEVHRQPEGWCELTLDGDALDLALQAGIISLAVSLTHERDIAAAVVVGIALA